MATTIWSKYLFILQAIGRSVIPSQILFSSDQTAVEVLHDSHNMVQVSVLQANGRCVIPSQIPFSSVQTAVEVLHDSHNMVQVSVYLAG